MASQLSLNFSFLLLLTVVIVVSAARNTPFVTLISSKLQKNGEMITMTTSEHFPKPKAEDDRTDHRLLAEHEERIGLLDYGDARANHRHDPHHPLAVKGNSKELDG